MKMLKRTLAMMLALIMMFSAVPFNAYATESTDEPGTSAETPVDAPETEEPVVEEPVVEDEVVEEPVVEEPVEEVTSKARSSSLDPSSFMRVFHLDCGRKYFTVDQIKELIDAISAKGFTHMELAIGNGGLRLLLDDMSVGSYSHEAVVNGIKSGNIAFSHAGEWSQTEMNTIISYAASKHIEIIPLLNTPGHMNTIVSAMKSVGISTPAYRSSSSTVDLEDSAAISFTKELVGKYIAYFDAQGCQYFNLGADEYAVDVLSDQCFNTLRNNGLYDDFAKYVNSIAEAIVAAGMTPIAFNDGIYYNKDTSTTFNSNLIVAYWIPEWGTYHVASPSFLISKGLKILNTNDDWYYVLGLNSGGGYGYNNAYNGVNNTPVTKVADGSTITTDSLVGAMNCVWCDTPSARYDSNKSNVMYFINTIAEKNPTFYVVNTSPAPEPEEPETVTKTDKATKVAITAPGLTGLTVTEATAPAIEGAAEGKVLAWNMVPVIGEANYEGEATVAVPVPAGWDGNKMGAFVITEGAVELLSGALNADGKFEFTMPHFSVGGVYEIAPAAATPVEIELEIGKTHQIVIKNEDLRGTYTPDPAGVATVDVKYEQVPGETIRDKIGSAVSMNSNGTYTGLISNGIYYMVMDANGNISSTQDINEATLFTVKRNRSSSYNISYGSYYLSVDDNELASAKNAYSWSYSSGFQYTTGRWFSQTYRLICSNGNWTVSSSNNSPGGDLYSYTTKTTDPFNQSTITFTGVSVGTTSVEIDGTTYNITVQKENLYNVTPLRLETWITNGPLKTSGTSSDTDTNADNDSYTYYYKEINATDDGINTEAGVAISSLTDNPFINSSGTEYIYWQSRYLTKTRQDTAASNNQTAAGDSVVRIRYWNGSWQYQNASGTWVPNMTTKADDVPQLVSYYLQKTEVTDEITTLVVDYGNVPYNKESLSPFVLVDYAVKYESGERTPTSFPTSTTIAFHCNTGSGNLNKTVFAYGNTHYRRLGIIRAVETAEYEVYMITLTPTSSDAATTLASNANKVSSYSYDVAGTSGTGNEKVIWIDDEANLGVFADAANEGSALRYTSPSGNFKYTVGGEPDIPGLEVIKNQGMLVTYYVRAKATEDALTVHYVDETENLEFYHYNIAVKEGTKFNEGIDLNKSNPNSNLLNGTVTNFHNKTQTVSADLKTLSQVGAQYLYTEYNCVRVERSADGKDVYLYYTFDPTVSFVVDFGLPMTITAADLSKKLENVTIEDMYFSETSTTLYTQYGKLTDNDNTITYAPTKIMRGTDHFTLVVDTATEVDGILDNAATTIAFRVYVVPATTVYYEESFLTYDSNWEGEDAAISVGPQTTEKLSTATEDNKQNNFGYDDAYDASKNGSNGSAATSNATGAAASFTFTGTGFQLYGNSDASSGFVTVYKQGAATKLYMINTKLTDTENVQIDDQTYYGLPFITETDLPYGTYTVQLKQTNGSNPIHIDGVRIFNTLENHSVFQYDLEDNPEFYHLRDYVLNSLDVDASTTAEQVYAALSNDSEAPNSDSAMITGTGISDPQKLLDNGPKNEVYLYAGQTLSFKVNTNRVAQLGLKAPTGSAEFNLNGAPMTLTSSVDMFYTVADKINGNAVNHMVTVEVTSGVLSVTELKVCDDPSFAFVPLTLEDVEAILGVEEAPETPEVPEVPETPTEPSKPVEPTEPEKPTEPEVEETKPSKPGKPNKPSKPGNNGNNKPGKPGNNGNNKPSQDKDEAKKVATLKITFVNIFGKKVATATLTKTQTANGTCVFTPKEISAQSPAGRLALWLIPVVMNYGSTSSIVVPVF